MADKYKVGEAPWETGEKEKFKVGEAPWETAPQGPAFDSQGFDAKGGGGALENLQKFAMAGHGPLAVVMNPAVQDVAVRGLDYLGGGIRTALAGMTGNATLDDLEAALKGRAPRSAEYLERAGVKPGPSVDMMGLANVNARDAAGFAGDIITDPLTYLAPGSKLGVNRAVGPVVEDAGRATYKSGLTRVDQEVAKYGKEPVSDILHRERVWGTERSIADQMDELANDRLARRNAILQEATDAGARVDRGSAMAPANEYLKHLTDINNPEQGALRATTSDRIASYLDQPGDMPTPMQTSAWKTTAANRVGDKNWEILRTTPEGKKLDKAISRGLKEATEESVGKTLGNEKAFELSTQNDELGRLLTSQEKAAHVADIAERKQGLTQVKSGLIASGLGHVAGAMEAAKFFGGAMGRTGGGLLLEDFGQTRAPDVLARRALIEANSPWAKMEEKKK